MVFGELVGNYGNQIIKKAKYIPAPVGKQRASGTTWARNNKKKLMAYGNGPASR